MRESLNLLPPDFLKGRQADKSVISQQKATVRLVFLKIFANLAPEKSDETISCDKLSLAAIVMRR